MEGLVCSSALHSQAYRIEGLWILALGLAPGWVSSGLADTSGLEIHLQWRKSCILIQLLVISLWRLMRLLKDQSGTSIVQCVGIGDWRLERMRAMSVFLKDTMMVHSLKLQMPACL